MPSIDQYLTEIELAIRGLSREAIAHVVNVLFAAWRRDAILYIIGNGGSASTASHMMNDFSKLTRVPNMPSIRAIALTDNVPLITAFANDESYEIVFTAQLESLMRPRDILIAISSSGNSKNILHACRYALNMGNTVIGLCGSPGGKLADLATCHIPIPAKHVGQHEDGHLILNHVIALALHDKIAAFAAEPNPISTIRGEVQSPMHA